MTTYVFLYLIFIVPQVLYTADNTLVQEECALQNFDLYEQETPFDNDTFISLSMQNNKKTTHKKVNETQISPEKTGVFEELFKDFDPYAENNYTDTASLINNDNQQEQLSAKERNGKKRYYCWHCINKRITDQKGGFINTEDCIFDGFRQLNEHGKLFKHSKELVLLGSYCTKPDSMCNFNGKKIKGLKKHIYDYHLHPQPIEKKPTLYCWECIDTTLKNNNGFLPHNPNNYKFNENCTLQNHSNKMSDAFYCKVNCLTKKTPHPDLIAHVLRGHMSKTPRIYCYGCLNQALTDNNGSLPNDSLEKYKVNHRGRHKGEHSISLEDNYESFYCVLHCKEFCINKKNQNFSNIAHQLQYHIEKIHLQKNKSLATNALLPEQHAHNSAALIEPDLTFINTAAHEEFIESIRNEYERELTNITGQKRMLSNTEISDSEEETYAPATKLQKHYTE